MEDQRISDEAKGMEDLKGLVIEALNKNAVLDSIRAQLRSTVFSAIQSQQDGPQPNKSLDTPEGDAAVALILDFLKLNEMQDTLKVLEPECAAVKKGGSSRLLQDLGLKSGEQPMIYSLLEAFKGNRESIEEDIQYEDDFEEYEPSQPRESATYGESGGSSMGIDASVDSMALEEFDYVEKVKRKG